jgi:hypothetical protein
MPKLHISSVLTLLALININCLAVNIYLSDTVPQIANALQANKDDLLSQRRTIDITESALNELVNKKEITQKQSGRAKKVLESIFENNFKNASSYERAIYNMKRPFQFVYNKITDPNASYLERFAYGAAAAVGVAVTGYTLYQGGKYAYSTPKWQIPSSSSLRIALMEKRIQLPSTEELTKRLANANIKSDIAHDIIIRLGKTIRNPMGVINTVEMVLTDHANKLPRQRQFTILYEDTKIINEILKDEPDIASAALEYARETFNK